MVCVHIRGVSPIQGAGLEGFHCIQKVPLGTQGDKTNTLMHCSLVHWSMYLAGNKHVSSTYVPSISIREGDSVFFIVFRDID